MPHSLDTLADRTRPWLCDPRLARRVTLIGCLLAAPGLFAGLSGDDYLHRAALLGVPGRPDVRRDPANLFAFIYGGAAVNQQAMDDGILPWWSPPDLRIAFGRPLTGWLHWLDLRLWPDQPVLMHLHSLAWFALAVYAAAGLYRRLIGSAWAAGLAALLFAIDDAHGTPAIWIANRNSMIALALGLLALRAHHDGRAGRIRGGAWSTAACFGLALLANEGAVAVGGYLLAHALFLEADPWRRRAAALLPSAAVGCAWLIGYKFAGFGVHAAEMYVDPISETGRYLSFAAGRLPLLLWGQWFTPPAEQSLMMSSGARHVFIGVAVAAVGLLGALMFARLRGSREARFFALGTLLAAAPVCATAAQDRLLQFTGIGGIGLLAMWIGAVVGVAPQPGATRVRRRPERVLLVVLLIVHMVAAPVALATTGLKFRKLGRLLEHIRLGMPRGEAERGREWIVLHTPSAFFTIFNPFISAMLGDAAPSRLLILSSGLYGGAYERIDDHALRLTIRGGMLSPVGTPSPDGPPDAREFFNVNYMCQALDLLFRRADAGFRVGERVRVRGLEITITRVTPPGRAEEIECRFDRPLDDDRFVWLAWRKDGTYAAVTPPPVGRRVEFGPAALPMD